MNTSTDQLNTAHAEACNRWDQCKDKFAELAESYSRKPRPETFVLLNKAALDLLTADTECDLAWKALKDGTAKTQSSIGKQS